MMSTRNLRVAMQPALRITSASRAVVGRGMHLSTSARLGLKESSNLTSEDYDYHKKDSLAKQKSGKGYWKPELASDSEEAIRADHAEYGSVKELQEKTKGNAEDKAKSGTSMNDGM